MLNPKALDWAALDEPGRFEQASTYSGRRDDLACVFGQDVEEFTDIAR